MDAGLPIGLNAFLLYLLHFIIHEGVHFVIHSFLAILIWVG